MGLFDPPTKSIAKRVPVSVQPILAAVQVFAEDAVPDDVGHTKKALVVAMAMGAWVNAHAQCGTFEMRQSDLDYVRNMYGNCARMAGPLSEMLPPILAELFDRGMLPEAMRDVFKPE